MRVPRVSVRRLMILMAILAGVFHVITTYYHVVYDPESRWIWHRYERADEPRVFPPEIYVDPCVAPFWPQFGRKLVGLFWPGSYECEHLGRWPTNELRGRDAKIRTYRYVDSRAVTRDEVWGIEASLRSLKTLGKPLVIPTATPSKDEAPAEAAKDRGKPVQ